MRKEFNDLAAATKSDILGKCLQTFFLGGGNTFGVRGFRCLHKKCFLKKALALALGACSWRFRRICGRTPCTGY